MVYLATPELHVDGDVSAAGGAGAVTVDGCAGNGGAGGAGRIRISTVPERCTTLGNWNPMLVDGCNVTASPGTAGRVYIDLYPF